MHGTNVKKEKLVNHDICCLLRCMEFYERNVICQTTRHHVPEDNNLRCHPHEEVRFQFQVVCLLE